MKTIRNRPVRPFAWSLAVALGLVIAASPLPGRAEDDAMDTAAVAHAKNLSRAFRATAKKVMPTVVKIRTATKGRTLEQQPGPMGENPFEGTPFEEFFNERQPGFQFHRRTPPQRGVGSGVIIDPKGVILTNNHVVENADEVVVQLADGREFKATDVKTDEQTDLAVVRIEADSPLTAATLGNSDDMEIGDWVIAIGHPFELDMTVSAGIISGKGRVLQAGKRATFLQTDAAINVGNSGGPLVNLDGRVVGINTAILAPSGGFQGVGFAIPSNLADWVVKQLIRSGTVRRAYLGVAIAELDNQLAEQLGVDPHSGVVVTEVYADTPAEKAGFRPGDVIHQFAGHTVRNPRQLQQAVERSKLNAAQKVDILRDGKPIALEVVTKPLPEDFGIVSAPRRERAEPESGFHKPELGLKVGELTDKAAEKLGHQGQTGVLVTQVDPDGPAAAAGLRPGMLILRVGRTEVASVEAFKKAVDQASFEEGVLLLIRTENGNRFVVVQGS